MGKLIQLTNKGRTYMEDYIIRAIDDSKSVRIFIARTTNMVQEIRDIHHTSATASAAMGRLATMAALMGINLKSDGDSLTLKVDGNGIGGRMTGVSDSKANVRILAENPQADCPANDKGKLDVRKFVGDQGQIAIIRDFGLKEPYTGLSEIVSGEIAEDFANYFFYSEQTPTVVSLGVLVDTDLSIKAAGGIFVQIMPDASDQVITSLEEIVKKLDPVSSMIDRGLSPEGILEEYFSEMSPEVLSRQEVSYKCNCSREKIESALISIGSKDLGHILEEDGKAEIVCDFCGKKYDFSGEDLEALLKEARASKKYNFIEMEQ